MSILIWYFRCITVMGWTLDPTNQDPHWVSALAAHCNTDLLPWLSISKCGGWVVAKPGQEHRLGRWWRDKMAKNELAMMNIPYVEPAGCEDVTTYGDRLFSGESSLFYLQLPAEDQGEAAVRVVQQGGVIVAHHQVLHCTETHCLVH